MKGLATSRLRLGTSNSQGLCSGACSVSDPGLLAKYRNK